MKYIQPYRPSIKRIKNTNKNKQTKKCSHNIFISYTISKKTSQIIWYCAHFFVILQRKGDERITYLHDEGEGSYTTVYLFYHARGNVFPRAW